MNRILGVVSEYLNHLKKAKKNSPPHTMANKTKLHRLIRSKKEMWGGVYI